MAILPAKATILDYGCGRGDDVETLKSLGYRARGWDPVHAPSTRRVPSEFVTCNFVINVIDRPEERIEVLQAAWALTKTMLLVSARLEHERDAAHTVPRSDGWLTSRGTFQKFFDHDELAGLITHAISHTCDAVAPGIYVIFKNERLRQEWKAKRLRLPSSPRMSTQSSMLLKEHRGILEPLIDFILERGRLPASDELESFQDILKTFGSTKMAFHVVTLATDRELWAQSAQIRSIELLAFLAISQFDEIDQMKKLSPTLQRDVRAHFGNFKTAHERATRLLFASGSPRAIDLACRASTVGKLTPTALYIHKSAVSELPALLRVLLGCSERIIGTISEVNIIKIFRNEISVSFLEYPNFDSDFHPYLERTWHLDLITQKFKTIRFGNRNNRPILHRLHDFVSPTHPRYGEWLAKTEWEIAQGWYQKPETIGTEDGWESATLKK